jgi:hypothetical protein
MSFTQPLCEGLVADPRNAAKEQPVSISPILNGSVNVVPKMEKLRPILGDVRGQQNANFSCHLHT